MFKLTQKVVFIKYYDKAAAIILKTTNLEEVSPGLMMEIIK